jgi:2-desacetyl-2-hydroxyethyl bacteriochlorophyllide A dehydrogenase
MRAIRIEEPGRFHLVDQPEPDPSAGGLVIEVGACGICGTDLHILAGEFPPTPYPIVPGHEAAGTVAKVGAGVSGFSEGDRVAIDPSLFCGTCDYCRDQRGNLCERWGAIGDTVDGAFAEFVAVPAANAYKIPDSMSFGAAALAEPVSCAVHALDRLDLRPGDRVLIYGAGTMGLILAQLLDRAGASQVSFVDKNPGRLDQVRRFGFNSVGPSTAAISDAPGRGYEKVIEATGVTAVAEQAINDVRKGGTLMIFGVTPVGETAAIEPFRIYNEEISVIGSMAVLASYGRAVQAVADGAIDADRMVTNVFDLEHFSEGLEAVREGIGIKTQIVPAI